MAIRYYLADWEDGGPLAGFPTSARCALRRVLARPGYRVLADGRAEATVIGGRCLVEADVTDAEHAVLVADAAVTYVPFEGPGGALRGLDDPISSVSAANRTAIRNRLDAWHIPTGDLVGSDPLRMVVRRVIRRFSIRSGLGPEDFVEGLDTTISQIPAARRQRISARLEALGFDTSVLLGTDTIREALRKLASQAVPLMRASV